MRKDAILISLAPKIAISKISERLEGFNKIVRMIPNACSIVNHGYNPVAFSTSLDESERKYLMKILAILGDCPEVDEDKLEAYAILAAWAPHISGFSFMSWRKSARPSD